MHSWDIRPSVHLEYTLKNSHAVQTLYPLVVTAIKSSILFLYLRISPCTGFRNVVLGHMLLCTAGGVVASIISLLQCTPIAKTWNARLPGECFDQYTLFQGVVIFNLVTNIMIIFLPMPTIWHLRLPLRQRILVLSVFSIGIIPCASLIARLILSSHHRVSGEKSRADAAWFFAPAENWAIVEICSGIICASLAPLKPLFKLLLPFLVELPQMIASGVRTFRLRAWAQVIKAKDMMRLKLDPYAHMPNSPPCAGNSDNTVERGEGVTATKEVSSIESHSDLQHIPEKVVIRSR